MKLHPCLLFLAVLCCPKVAIAQNVGPGNIASGFAAQRGGSSIDYATGIMQYSIPLFRFEQDGYEVPIALTYNATGIKLEDQPSLAGFGWSLGYGGGIVTRTIKGGIADEEPTLGCLNNPYPSSPLNVAAYRRKVSANKIDGESDIFQVNIQGNTIRFILRKNGNTLLAESLVKNDYKITCNQDFYGTHINGWTITDAEGNIYQFVASDPGNAFIQNPVPTNSFSKNAINSWYLQSVQLMNNGKVNFEYYEAQYAEMYNATHFTYNYYGVPFTFPMLGNDYALQAELASLQSQVSPANAARVAQLRENITKLTDLRNEDLHSIATASREEVTAQRESGVAMNLVNVNSYNAAITAAEREIQQITWQTDALTSNIVNVLAQMYNNDYSVSSEFTTGGGSTVSFNKLLKKILLRNAIIEIEYTPLQGSNLSFFMYSRINYRTVEGDLLKTVLFQYLPDGQLKKVQVTGADKTVEQEYTFQYYNEGETLYYAAQDYWGYYNGKLDNTYLFPIDPAYTVFNPSAGKFTTVFGATGMTGDYNTDVYNKFGGMADRKPDGSQAAAKSLKQVNSLMGDKVIFEYEGNKVYSEALQDNVNVGGIRIKKITLDPGHGTPLITNYKYDFPLLSNPSYVKSTGRLVEWKKKYFTWKYAYGGSADDTHVFTESVNIGGADESNSNNGVLYHYVEEVNNDNSATGYKYPAINSEGSDLYHTRIMDNALMAKIDYNANGKIVRIERNGYLTNEIYGTRTTELTQLNQYNYFQFNNMGLPTYTQVGKEPIFYDYESLSQQFSYAPEYVTNFEQYQFSIIPYLRIFTPNYAPRCKETPVAEDYVLATQDILQLREQQTYIFNDYNTSTAHAASNFPGLPDEKAYLFERLLAASNVPQTKSSVRYNYNGLTQLPSSMETTDSRGVQYLTRTKYAGDYMLASSDVITKMQYANYKGAVVEKQSWVSKNQGTSYELLNGDRYDYKEVTINGQSNFLVDKIYRLQQSAAFSPSTYGFSENALATTATSTVAWENNTLYKPEGAMKWGLYNNFIRPTGIVDRAGRNKNIKIFDKLRDFLLVEGTTFDPDNAAAIDFSPYISHPYYRDFGFFNSNTYLGDFNQIPFSAKPFTTTPEQINIMTMDHPQYAMEAFLHLEQFKIDHPTEWAQANVVPLFQELQLFFSIISSRSPLNNFIFEAARVRKWRDELSQQDELLLLGLQGAGLEYAEIKQYLNFLFLSLFSNGGGTMNYQSYEDVIIASRPTPVLPLNFDGSFLLKVNVEKLVASGKNLDIFFANNTTSSLNTKLYYTNSTSPASYTISGFTGINDKIRKTTVQLSSLPDAAELKEIEFNIPSASQNGSMIAIPANSMFKAYSYLPDGKPYLSYDQNGEYQSIFYNQIGQRTYTKDFKGNVIAVDSITLANNTASLNNIGTVVIRNDYLVNDLTAPRITKVQFGEIGATAAIEKTTLVTPDQISITTLPVGNYNLTIETSSPAGKVWINGTQYTSGTIYSITISATQSTSISISQ